MSTATRTSLLTLEHLQALDFWARVAIGGSGDCWEWTRGRTAGGYGYVHVGTRITGLERPVAIGAHRVALALHRGEMPDPHLVIDHRCRNPACCNPSHLDLVSQLRNVRRGRKTLRPIRHPRRDGSARWMVRYYDYSEPKRRYLSRSFDTEAEAEAYIADMKASWRV